MILPLFDTGLKVILFAGAVFFFVFSYVCLMWTTRTMTSMRNIVASAVVSLIHSFKIVLLSVFILGLVQIVILEFFS